MCDEFGHQIKRGPSAYYNKQASSSRPISLDLHTYSHQEALIRRHGYRNLTANSADHRLKNYENKENKSGQYDRKNYGMYDVGADVRSQRNAKAAEMRRRAHCAQFLHQKFAVSPSSSSTGGAEGEMLAWNNSPCNSKPVYLDAFSATSSIFSGEDVSDCNDDGGVYDKLDENQFKEDNDEYFSDESPRHRNTRNMFYSTSDLTTSDSEIFRHPSTMASKRKDTFNLAKKFPSLSTIYPDNSSNSFEECELRHYKAEKNRYKLHQIDKRSSTHSDEHKKIHEDSFRLGSSSCNTPPPKVASLQMIEEISPVLPPPDANDDVDLPPVIQPLKMSKEWKPIQTSTMTDFHRQMRGTLPPPKTNPRHLGVSSTPRHFHQQPALGLSGLSTTASICGQGTHSGVSSQYAPQLRRNTAQNTSKNGVVKQVSQLPGGSMEAPTPPPKSLFDPYYQDLSETCPNANDIRPEQYNLPSQLARKLDVKGILYLSITIEGWMVRVSVRNAAYFFKDRLPVSSFVKVELKRNKEYRKRTKCDSRFKAYRSSVVPATNRPDFFEEFKFDVSNSNLKFSDRLSISVYSTVSNKNSYFAPNEVIGRMSFSLRKLFRKANSYHDMRFYENSDPIKVCDGGYFLLPEKSGSENHLSQDNILHRKYYDEIGSTTTFSTTSSLHSGSPLKMMSEPEWRSHNSAFKMPSRTACGTDVRIPSDMCIAPATFSDMPAGTMSAGNNSPYKKMTDNGLYYCDQLYLQQQQTNGSSAPLENLQQTLFNRFNCGQGKKPFVQGASSALKTNTQSSLHNTNTTKSDGNMVSMLDYTASTSSSSGTSSGIEYKRRHRCTLPSITTTITDSTTSDYSNGDSIEHRQDAIDYHFLYANAVRRQEVEAATGSYGDENEGDQPQSSGHYALSSRGLSRKERPSSQKQKRNAGDSKNGGNVKHTSVRRVASFTFSPEGSFSKHNKRHEPPLPTATRKFTLGPLARTFSYFRNKVDTAISSNSLYVTLEECKLWQESFEALLHNKFGRLLFRQFLKQEFSVENLEFWQECEYFKKMKDGRRATQQKSQAIYNTFIKDGAEKEVNLDSATKTATKAALEIGIRADTFNLAQTKIEQLMAKDSYQRFLKSDLYLQLLNSTVEQQSESTSALNLETSTTTDNLLVRTGSARDTTHTKAAGTARRHTCVPDQSETLAMQEMVKRAQHGKLLMNVEEIDKLSKEKEKA